jgi:hypothetical protein
VDPWAPEIDLFVILLGYRSQRETPHNRCFSRALAEHLGRRRASTALGRCVRTLASANDFLPADVNDALVTENKRFDQSSEGAAQ